MSVRGASDGVSEKVYVGTIDIPRNASTVAIIGHI